MRPYNFGFTARYELSCYTGQSAISLLAYVYNGAGDLRTKMQEAVVEVLGEGYRYRYNFAPATLMRWYGSDTAFSLNALEVLYGRMLPADYMSIIDLCRPGLEAAIRAWAEIISYQVFESLTMTSPYQDYPLYSREDAINTSSGSIAPWPCSSCGGQGSFIVDRGMKQISVGQFVRDIRSKKCSVCGGRGY